MIILLKIIATVGQRQKFPVTLAAAPLLKVSGCVVTQKNFDLIR
jgi:hypothetical protein